MLITKVPNKVVALHKKWSFPRKLRIWSHLLKKSLIENFSFCTVLYIIFVKFSLLILFLDKVLCTVSFFECTFFISNEVSLKMWEPFRGHVFCYSYNRILKYDSFTLSENKITEYLVCYENVIKSIKMTSNSKQGTGRKNKNRRMTKKNFPKE